MANAYNGFLDDISLSKSPKSPIKTSTATKDNIKWNEDAFFKRQDLAVGSESLFQSESPISALNEVTNVRKVTLQKPVFHLNDSSFISEGTNSSLGILNMENLSDLNESTLFESSATVRRKKSKKKLQKVPRVSSEVKFESLNFQEKFPNETKAILESLNKIDAEETDFTDSSDIEYDGTNVPELNLNFDVLSLHNSAKVTDYASRSSILTDTDESKSGGTLKLSNEAKYSQNSFMSSQFAKDEIFASDSGKRKSSGNIRKSIFENYTPSYDSLYQQLAAGKRSVKTKAGKIPPKIKVCPFLDMSSFEVEPILHKQDQSSIASDVEYARCNENQSTDFYPEQISARSSSFKSSLKSALTTSEMSNDSKRGKLGFSISLNQNFSFPTEDLENEVLSGSCFQASGTKLESHVESFENLDNNDLGSSLDNFGMPENSSQKVSLPNELAFHTDLVPEEMPGFAANGENWCSRLGISESDFFSSDTAKEMLKKDKEAFEKENMFECMASKKYSGLSNWSPPNQLEVTAPSWLSELNPENERNSDRHISIGTLISARTEHLGSLSEDSERERPFFGTVVTTPTKLCPSSRYRDLAPKESGDANSFNFQDSNLKQIRSSALSELLNDISITDPINFASKIVEKCMPNMQDCFQNLDASKNISCVNNEENIQYLTGFQKELSRDVLCDLEESKNTLVRSTSVNNASKQADSEPKSDSKSTAAECMENLEFLEVASTRESIKTAQSYACSNCSLSSQQTAPLEFLRPTSSCSSASNNSVPQQNAYTVQYGCMKYLNTGQEHNRCMIPNNYLFQQNDNSTLPCSHVCAQHTMQPNFLSLTAANLQSVQGALSGSSLPLHLSGTRVSCLQIEAPAELCFPDKIALGDSQEMNLTIRNPASISCYYHISCVSAYLNDSPLPLEMSGLSYNNNVTSSSGNATDIKLVLAPKYEGKIEVNLQIDAFPNSIGPVLNAGPAGSIKTKVQFEALRPSISLLSKGKSTLNLGHVIVGSTFVEHVTLVNNCEVSVPLRISLSNDSDSNQIYFGLKEIDRQKHPVSGGPRFLSPKVLLFRLPGSKIKFVPSQLDIPVVFESIRGRVSSTITAAIETPTLSEVLAFITISASAGNAKLVLKDASQNPLVLRAANGSTCNHSLTIMNEGTLPVVYDFHIDSDSDCFSVSPNSLNLQPKQSTTISVTFQPLTSQTVKGNLLAAAEPHGQVFNVTEIIGAVQTNSYASHRINPRICLAQPTRDSPIESSNLIECNKKWLSWGSEDIGSTQIKTFTLRNSGKEDVQARVYIKEKSQGFQLIDDSSQKTFSYDLALAGKEEKLMSIAFMPKGVASYSGLLCVKPVEEKEHTVFSIPLSGYGGTSKLKVLDLPDGEGTGYCLDVDVSHETETVYKNITLHNFGLRAAFVKLHVIYDGFMQNPIQKQTIINPSEFVLLENEKRNVIVSLNCTNRSFASNTEVITILYGDEIMRQGLRRKTKSGFPSNDPAYNVNFNVPYDGEDRVPYDSSRMFSPKDDSTFYAHVKKLMIHIFFNGQNASFSRMSFAPLSVVQESFSNLSLNSTRRLTIEGHSPPVKESTMRNMTRLSLPTPFADDLLLKTTMAEPSLHSFASELESLVLCSWTVQPEELILDADNKDNRILLKSCSNIDMRFKAEWTIDVITVSPVSGVLPANGEIGLRLTLINNNHNKLSDDYHGSIKILCDGTEKNVAIKVIRDQKRIKNASTVRISPPPPAINLSLRSGFLGDSAYLDNTVIEATPQTLHVENISNFPKLINLPKAKLGVFCEMLLIVGNPSKHVVSWSIHPISIIFTQPFEDSIDSASSAIEFLSASGVLKSKETTNIAIKFSSGSIAEFSQFFELSLNYENGVKQTFNIKVQGETITDSNGRHLDITDRRKSSTLKKRSKSTIFVENEMCEFNSNTPREQMTSSIIIKNLSSQNCKFSVIKPSSPFSLLSSSITVKCRKYLKVPVLFKPVKPGCYESEVKFISENGHELKVRLKGNLSI